MPYVHCCAHCYSVFSTEHESDVYCHECRDPHTRLVADCSTRADPAAAMVLAQTAIRRLKQRQRPLPPTTLTDAISFLREHPHVQITGHIPGSAGPVTLDQAFICYSHEDGGLLFRGWDNRTYIPVPRVRAEEPEDDDTCIDWDDTGFTVKRFGAQVRVEYLP